MRVPRRRRKCSRNGVWRISTMSGAIRPSRISPVAMVVSSTANFTSFAWNQPGSLSRTAAIRSGDRPHRAQGRVRREDRWPDVLCQRLLQAGLTMTVATIPRSQNTVFDGLNHDRSASARIAFCNQSLAGKPAGPRRLRSLAGATAHRAGDRCRQPWRWHMERRKAMWRPRSSHVTCPRITYPRITCRRILKCGPDMNNESDVRTSGGPAVSDTSMWNPEPYKFNENRPQRLPPSMETDPGASIMSETGTSSTAIRWITKCLCEHPARSVRTNTCLPHRLFVFLPRPDADIRKPPIP